MTNEEKILALAQSIYLARNNRYNDVDGTEKDEFIAQTIDWVNQYIEELELETYWNYVRENGQVLGVVNEAGNVRFPLPETVQRLVVSPYRNVTITHDGAIVATFQLVNPSQIADPTNLEVRDRATVIGRNLIFSRELKDTEVGGEVHADAVSFIPRLSLDDTTMLELVQPKQLIVLGVAKNATLPDIVQGGISPSLTQKYGDLLEKAVAENNATAGDDEALREDFSFIGGIW